MTATTDPALGPTAPRRPATATRADADTPAGARVRDPRLDFFRGLAMFIILIAHVPGNAWTKWIPARFGYSDATEIFVFCSGMASAIAFGGTFARRGAFLGTARTLFRIWQVYWAHVGLFLVIAGTMAALDATGAFERCYVCRLNLTFFFEDTASQLVGLMTLTYVPNYFDILPMYLVILAMMPAMVLLARVHVALAVALSVTLWLVAQFDYLSLPAEPWSDREWFFNPFGWQLIFFTGFALMAGWLPQPPVDRRLIWAAAGFLVLTMPLSSPRAVGFLEVTWPAAAQWSMSTFDAMNAHPVWSTLRAKTDFGLFRYLHFLSLAYIAWILVGAHGRRLVAAGGGIGAQAWNGLVTFVTKVGQQSLAIFVFSMFFSQMLGVLLDQTARGAGVVALVNLAGLATLVAVAYFVAWVKAHPWRGAKA